MAIELYGDNNPSYVYNRHTNYENIVLSEHANIVSGFRETNITQANMEMQARLFIGVCLKSNTENFIKTKFEDYYKEAIKDEGLAKITDKQAREHMATVRTWTRLINEALDIFIKKYKVDGSKAKIAVLDIETMDGRPIVECDEFGKPIVGGNPIEDDPIVDFTSDEKGL
jgi:hypothetical protein